MKRIAIIITLALSAACSGRQMLCNGDLVFVHGGDGEADQAITGATGSFSHVGIVEVAGDSVFVIDASFAGVQRRPLEAFIAAQEDADGTMPQLVWKRVRDNSLAAAWVGAAKALVGCSYDFTYLPDNEMYYCSELVYDCYLDRDGNHIFNAAPMNFKNSEGGYDSFWIELFDSLGMDVPQGVDGTNPSDMSRSGCLVDVVLD